MTMHAGLVDQATKFTKRIASTDTSTYKVVGRGQLVVGFPIDEGVLDFQDLYDEAIVSPAYSIWNITDDKLVFRPYLQKFLRSDRAVSYYAAKLRGSTARRRSLPTQDFLGLQVPLPSYVEQQRIASLLDHADALRTKRRQAIDHLDSLTQSIFHEVFGPPPSWANRWPMGTISNLATSVNYGTSAKAGATGHWPVLRMGNITDEGRLDLTDLKYMDLSTNDEPKYTVAPGDMLFNRTNSKEKVGKAAVVRTGTPLAFAGYLVRVRFSKPAYSEFVSAYLRSGHGRSVRQRLAKNAVNQANINATEMNRIPIALPPEDVVAQFSHRVSTVEMLRDKLMSELQVQGEHFNSLQSRAFRGEL